MNITVLLGDPSLPDRTKPEGCFTPEDLDSVARLKNALDHLDQHTFAWLNDHDALLDRLALRPEFVLNFGDTGYRNDPTRELHLPALLELLGVPYSGSGPVCLGLCYDKAMVRAIAAAHGVPVPGELFVAGGTAGGPPADQLELEFPVLVKPARADGSVGITAESVVDGPESLERRIASLRQQLPGTDLLVQEYLTGAEYAIGLIGNPGHGFDVLPPLEVDYSGLPPDLPPILAYESKTTPTSPYWTELRYRPAQLADGDRDRMVEWSRVLFERLGCRDYARFDFRADAHGRPRLLEANPNPAWCWDGKLNLMAGFRGWDYSQFLGALIDAALRREGLTG